MGYRSVVWPSIMGVWRRRVQFVDDAPEFAVNAYIVKFPEERSMPDLVIRLLHV
jgi:hypothetical protein